MTVNNATSKGMFDFVGGENETSSFYLLVKAKSTDMHTKSEPRGQGSRATRGL
jgi:hypothetical protein